MAGPEQLGHRSGHEPALRSGGATPRLPGGRRVETGVHRLALTIAGAVLLLLAVSAGAGATTPERIAFGEVFDPVLAGDRVLWQEDAHRTPALLAAVPGEAPATVATFEPITERADVYRHLSVAASPEALAVLEERLGHCCARYHDPWLEGKRVLARPWPGALVDHGDVCASPEQSDVAIAGTRVAYLAACPYDEDATLRIRDVLTGDTTDLSVQRPSPRSYRGHAFVRMAGDLVAWVERDAASGEQVIQAADLRSGERRALWRGTGLAGWDVRPDGAVALAMLGQDDRRGAALRWVDAGGTEHALPGRPEAWGDPIRLVGDTVAVVLRRDAAAPAAKQTLALVGLEGTVRPVALFDGDDAPFNAADPGGFDFDGTRIVWAERQCEEATIWALDVSELGAPVPGPARRACRHGRVDTRTATVGRSGRFTVEISCSEGCVARLRIGRSGPQRRIELGPSWAPHRVQLRLSRRALERWPAGRPRRVRVQGGLYSAGDWDPVHASLVLIRRGEAPPR